MDADGWVTRLTSDTTRELAIEELRSYLVGGLTRALSHRYGRQLPIEDVVQLTLIRILGTLDQFEGRGHFKTWAMAIGVRIGISELRRNYYRDATLFSTDPNELFRIEPTDRQAVPVEIVLQQEAVLSVLQKLIEERLSAKQKVAIRATLDGLPVEEIAARMSSNRNAIYKLIHDARMSLRKGFEENGINADDVVKIFSKA